MNGLLEVQGLSVRFGGVVAVDDVSFALPAGSVTGLIGPNGAGKTTTIDAICGFVPASGRVALDGTPIDDLAPHRRVRGGLARTFQSIELFEDLTVAENLAVAARRTHWWTALVDMVAPRRATDSAETEALLERVGLVDCADAVPTSLPHGRRRLVSVARAMALSPKVLLLDEPAAGLDPDETSAFGRFVSELAATGLAVLLVEHDMQLVQEVCERLIVLDVGRIIADGPTASVCADPAVTAAYLGTST